MRLQKTAETYHFLFNYLKKLRTNIMIKNSCLMGTICLLLTHIKNYKTSNNNTINKILLIYQ